MTTQQILEAARSAKSALALADNAARMVTGSGADMVIANDAHPELLYDIAAGKPAGTRFAARKED